MSLENVKVFGQNSIRITYNGKVMYIDPLYIDNQYNDADFIFVTHDHYDHFSPDDINKVKNENSIIIVPEKMKRKVVVCGFREDKTVSVAPDELYEIEGLKFKTTYSYNEFKPFHPAASNWVGYILELDQNYYIAGDTDNVPELSNIKCDVAFVPVGGTYTMNYKEAANLINRIKPKIAVPVHYGSIVGKKEDGQSFIDLVNDEVECKLMF